MNLEGDIVIVTVPGKMTNQYIYFKNYVYSIGIRRLLKPNIIKNKGGKYWKDVYFLHPGKYLIIEVDIDIENNWTYNCLTVFTKEDYLSIKRKQFPDSDIGNFKKIYHSCGSEITEWKGDIPNWVELPSELLPEIREDYKQPQEVEDKLSILLKKDDTKRSAISYLSKMKGN